MYQTVPILAALLTALLLFYKARKRSNKPYPPGPKGKPIIGNALTIPSTHSWLYYTGLKKEYGDILYLTAFGQPMIVLNSLGACKDLLLGRASIYSDRPRIVMVGEMMGWHRVFGFMPYGQEWREHRRLVHTYMSKKSIGNLLPNIEKETKLFLARLVKQPEQLTPEIRLTTAKLIVHSTYGIEIDSPKDELLTLGADAFDIIMAATIPGQYLVDLIPALRHVPAWVPGAGNFNRVARSGLEAGERMVSIPYGRLQRDMAENKAAPSFASYLMDKMKDGTLSDAMDKTNAQWLSGTMYGAGTDTTVSTIQKFFLSMMLFPDAQRKAQAEIDQLVARENRLPTWEEKADLPYVECLIKELYRWNTIGPLALPHRTLADDEYKGYFIPKGSVVLGNAWAISQDEIMYPEPKKFFPERFMPTPGPDGVTPAMPTDPRQYAFGFGRRVCVGIHFAEAVVYTTVVSVLATLSISKAIDGEGKEIEPSLEFGGAMISHAPAFQCKIHPRSSAKLALINDLATEAVL